MTDLISIIIPVYNSQDYIQECVESILQSTYQQVELLLLDDGSSDNSAEICKRLAAGNPKIKYEYLEHRGVSATRNTGLDRAGGAYVFFMDSDDAIHPQLLECLYRNCVEKQASLAVPSRLMVESVVWNQRMQSDRLCKQLPECVYFNPEELLREFFWKNIWLHSLGGIMIRKDLAAKVRFAEDIARGEDTMFVYHCVLQQSDCVFLKKEWYYYRMHDSNTTKVLSKESIENVYAGYKRIYDSELALGREENAKHWMRKYAMSLTHYYRLAKEAKNTALQKYIRGVVNEKRQELCIGMTPKERIRYILCFKCYPMYRVVCKGYLSVRAVRSLIKR